MQILIRKLNFNYIIIDIDFADTYASIDGTIRIALEK
jgi:hypothetical protein